MTDLAFATATEQAELVRHGDVSAGELFAARTVEAPHALALLAEKYPQYRREPPAGPVIAIAIEERTIWPVDTPGRES